MNLGQDQIKYFHVAGFKRPRDWFHCDKFDCWLSIFDCFKRQGLSRQIVDGENLNAVGRYVPDSIKIGCRDCEQSRQIWTDFQKNGGSMREDQKVAANRLSVSEIDNKTPKSEKPKQKTGRHLNKNKLIIDFTGDHETILENLKIAARNELRSIENQVLYILKSNLIG